MKAINRNWWILLVQGVFFVAVGAAGFFSDSIGLAEVTQYLGLVFAVFGFLMMTFGFGFRKRFPHWVFLLISGLIQLAFGVAILAYPTASTDIFTYLVGGFALAIGLFQLIYGISRKAAGMLYIINAVISLIFGILIVLKPFDERETLTFVVCLYSIILGITMGYYAFKIRRWSRRVLEKRKESESSSPEGTPTPAQDAAGD